VTVTASLASGSAVLANATAVTDSTGLATFSGLTITGSNGNDRLQFAASGYTPVQASADTVLSGSTYQTPDLINNASFEPTDGNGTLTPAGQWDGFTNAGLSGAPTGGTYCTLTLDPAQHYAGVQSVNYTWGANTGDDSAQLWHSFTAQDHVWQRFYFRLKSGWNLNIQKFMVFHYHTGAILGGFDLTSGGIDYSFVSDAAGVPTTLLSKAAISNDTWHSLEVDCWRNGDTGFDGSTSLPSAAFWFDGVQIINPLGGGGDGPDGSFGGTYLYWKNGRVYPNLNNGYGRGSSLQVDQFLQVGTRNGPNTGSGTLWLDRIALSSLGRIGP